ncbi:hypothetical protein DY000_02048491 [Brassica cretica]|uniref:Uncharacterized protein n=1 Tax=Brassica cretica TaxID=69181 RepID=A0ABQ7F1I8_BRACR|nr:hypothetical protein DY000_02048491 [Brassica cretica]
MGSRGESDMGSRGESDEQFMLDPEYSPANIVDLETHEVIASLAAAEEFADQIAEGGESGVVRKKQGSKRKLISLTDDTDDSDVEITPPTGPAPTPKPRRKTTYGTASRKPIRKPVHDLQKKNAASIQLQKKAPKSQKKKEKVEEIPEFDDELEEVELDAAEIDLEDLENRQRSDMWTDFKVVEKPSGDLKAMKKSMVMVKKLPSFESIVNGEDENDQKLILVYVCCARKKKQCNIRYLAEQPAKVCKKCGTGLAAFFRTASRAGQACRVPPEDEPAAVRDRTGWENPIDIPINIL